MAEYDAPPPPEADEEYKKVTDINYILALRKSEDIPNEKNLDARVRQLLSSPEMQATQPTSLLQAPLQQPVQPIATGGKSRAKSKTRTRSKSKTRAKSRTRTKSRTKK